jgi:glutamate-1-semialdehyde 2,1-aminomutase
VLDLGAVPATEHFPAADVPLCPSEAAHPLAMDLCTGCGLAQLADDDTVTAEPRGGEPQALRDQAEDAVQRVAAAGWLTGTTVDEFGSPHGGSWLSLLAERGFTPAAGPADVVIDCFGIMHEPHQRAAFAERAAATAGHGVLLLQYHALAGIVSHGQWDALRHGHFGYYSMPALTRLFADAGMRAVAAWHFDLYGGTVLVAAVHRGSARDRAPGGEIGRMLTVEATLTEPATVASLQSAADAHAGALRSYLEAQRAAGRRVYAFGAASRAVALFARAGLDHRLLAAVADTAPAKQGRRMPGTDIPVISPEALVAAAPDVVVLTLADLLPEVSARLPELMGRWVTDDWIATQTGR